MLIIKRVILCILFILCPFILMYAQSFTNTMIKVAKQKITGTDTLLVCDYAQLNDRVQTVPLSSLTEDLQIVQLSNQDEALIGTCVVFITDYYLLTRTHNQTPYKLFDKQGNFLASIGRVGPEEGEYKHIYDQKIDEKNGFIYLLPWNSDHLLKYNLKGQYIGKELLGGSQMKGLFWIDPDSETITIARLVSSPEQPVVSHLEKGSKVKNLSSSHLAVSPRNPYNNEVIGHNNTSEKDFLIFRFSNRTADTLYHYNQARNCLVPVFTTNFESPIPIHNYMELPQHFIGEVAEEKQLSENSYISSDQRYYLVDKNSGKGSYIRLINDFLGNEVIEYPNSVFNNGYFYGNIEPMELSRLIEKALCSETLSPTLRARFKVIKDQISSNDNNYIIYAKLKK